MLKEPINILGINPGTRYLALSVFQGHRLFEWKIKLLKGEWSKKKIERAIDVISECAELHDINRIALKKLHPAHSSKHLELLVSRIKALARRKKLRVCQFSIREIEKYLLEDATHNKKNLAEKMVSDHPCLIHEREKEKIHKNLYCLRMFEAVALGTACFQRYLESLAMH